MKTSPSLSPILDRLARAMIDLHRAESDSVHSPAKVRAGIASTICAEVVATFPEAPSPIAEENWTLTDLIAYAEACQNWRAQFDPS